MNTVSRVRDFNAYSGTRTELLGHAVRYILARNILAAHEWNKLGTNLPDLNLASVARQVQPSKITLVEVITTLSSWRCSPFFLLRDPPQCCVVFLWDRCRTDITLIIRYQWDVAALQQHQECAAQYIISPLIYSLLYHYNQGESIKR